MRTPANYLLHKIHNNTNRVHRRIHETIKSDLFATLENIFISFVRMLSERVPKHLYALFIAHTKTFDKLRYKEFVRI